MQTYYRVTSTFNSDGRISAELTGWTLATEPPEDTENLTADADVYNDWFETREEADEFVRVVLRENAEVNA